MNRLIYTDNTAQLKIDYTIRTLAHTQIHYRCNSILCVVGCIIIMNITTYFFYFCFFSLIIPLDHAGFVLFFFFFFCLLSQFLSCKNKMFSLSLSYFLFHRRLFPSIQQQQHQQQPPLRIYICLFFTDRPTNNLYICVYIICAFIKSAYQFHKFIYTFVVSSSLHFTFLSFALTLSLSHSLIIFILTVTL